MAVIFIGLLIAASVIVPTLFTISSETGEAFSTQSEQIRDQKNTAISVHGAENTTENVTVSATNEGTRTLDLSSTDLLVDGDYVPLTATETVVIAGDDRRNATSIWPPSTDLEVSFTNETVDEHVRGASNVTEVDRVTIVTETAISDASRIEAAGDD
ncbi:flagellin [Natrarchaeobius oligotrophus]|uniref:Flagellin n=2 Tax=Natrarchaeobius TaxID=2501796 RepID=A0A3N6MW46_NATCH|nr:flagellin [Natrarchaeobius chitinivorans]